MPAKKTAKKTAKRRTKNKTVKRRSKKTTRRTARPYEPKGAGKSARLIRGRPFTGKDDPRNGRGAKGRSGRIPNELKIDCQDCVFSYALPKIVNYIKAPKKTVSDAGWRWAVDYITERGFGKVPLPVTGDDEGDPIGVRLEQETAIRGRILEQLSRIASRK